MLFIKLKDLINIAQLKEKLKFGEIIGQRLLLFEITPLP